MRLRVISWNLNNRDDATSDEQLQFLMDWEPDVMVLQEVTKDRAKALAKSLEAERRGLHCVSSFAGHRQRRNGGACAWITVASATTRGQCPSMSARIPVLVDGRPSIGSIPATNAAGRSSGGSPQ
jgi:exonuclease III